MFGSEGCLKADVVPGCILSTNCLLVIGHYSRTETCCPEGNCTSLETIMELASWQTALSMEYASPAECVFSREDEKKKKKVDTHLHQNVNWGEGETLKLQLIVALSEPRNYIITLF